jgi:hypothetical protein
MAARKQLFNKFDRLVSRFELEDRHFHNPENHGCIDEFQYRLQEVEELVPKIHEAHDGLLDLDLDDNDTKVVQIRFAAFNTRYRQLIGNMRNTIRIQQEAAHATRVESTRLADESLSEQARQTKWKLPPLKLMEWDGSDDTWPVFKDLFVESIYNDPKLPTIVKYQYLLSYVKFSSSQANVLKNFPLTAEYFEIAWQALVARYDDKKKRKSDQFNKLFSTKRMAGESATEMRAFIDSFEASVRVLKQLDASWDDMLLHVAQHRLDEQTRKDWQKEIGETDEVEWEDLKKFLVRRWKQLDSVPIKKLNTRPVPQQVSKAKTFAVAAAMNSNRKFDCLLGDGEHMLYKCEMFLAQSPQQRFNIIKEKDLCWLCFSPNHSTKQCRHQDLLKCEICRGRHNKLIHVGKTHPLSSANATSTPSKPLGAIPKQQQQQKVNVNTSQQQPAPQFTSTPIRPNETRFTQFGHSSQQSPSSSDSFEVFQHHQRQQFSAVGGNEDKSGFFARHAFFTHRQTLLPTIRANILDANGFPHEVRALMDTGSDTNFLSTQMAKKLQLPFNQTQYEVVGINGSTTLIRHQTEATISSLYGSYTSTIEFSVMDVITGNMPGRSLSRKIVLSDDYYHADPDFAKPAPVDMLLSINVFLETLLSGKIRLAEGPWMFHTMFGWAIGGSIFTNQPTLLTSMANFCNQNNNDDEGLQQQLEKFMEIENYGATKKTMSPEEKHCEEFYKSTTKRDESGRYIVQLPMKPNIAELGHNRSNSFRQYSANEKRRQGDEVFNSMYVDYMKDFEETGHMSEVESSYDGYYVPHHGVKRESSTTTKLRTVFNASSKSETGLSLNDCLYVGPTVQPESFDILMRFRERPYVLKCDIEKMFRQILVDESQRKFQMLFWRAKFTDAIRHYVINTVMFGVAPAPFLATRTLVQIADDYGEAFPEVAKIIRESFYVDDGMFGCESIDEAIKVRDQLRLVLMNGGMPTRKWISNEKSLYDRLPIKDIETIEDETTTIKALGMTWNPTTDKLACNTKKHRSETINKTTVLSEIASLHDPLGIVGPVILAGKLFMKQLVIEKLDWKEEAPEKFKQGWRKFIKHIDKINHVFVERHAIIKDAIRVELHGFSDASEAAYGCAIYLRSINAAGRIKIVLICSKSRISPLKKKSVARLELCGMLLLAKLVARITSILIITIDGIYLWCDSMISLYWVRTPSYKLGTFVGNRVAIIQELTEKFTWRHIAGIENPADLVSRGLLPEEIEDCELWWNGPSFLCQPEEEWPESLITISEDEPEYLQEFRKTYSATKPAICENKLYNEIEEEAVDYDDLISTFSYLLRFFKNAAKGNEKQMESLTIDELEDARLKIVKIVQQQAYPIEFKYFTKLLENPQQRESFPEKSTLKSLAPFLEKEKRIIRVGGRIAASPVLSDSQKHQIVLPEGNFAKLIIKHEHVKNLHAGVSATMSFVREEYWPKSLRNNVRNVIRKCIVCFRAKPELATQFMSSLQLNRLLMTHPFTRSACDYGGPFSLRASLTARASIVKAWIAMFKCMCTGAIHIEVVTTLSTEGFIMAFDRFTSRRGLSVEIYSDNGTNFVGANNEFQRILAECEEDIGEHLKKQGIKWHFTTPLAPHAGGYYEAGIKAVKHHMTRVMSGKSFDFEQFTTILTKIEAIVNSRPLTPMSEDPTDLSVLTPGHFLIGRPLIAKPERRHLKINENRLDKYNRLQQVQQRFWDAWYHEYLHQLQTRPVGFREKQDFEIGQLVLLKDDNLPTMKWLTGRIIHIYPTKDGITRRVKVHTSKGDKDRDVRYLCLLPIESATAGENVSERKLI